MSQETISIQVKPYNEGDFGMGAAIKAAFSQTFSGEFIRACAVWLLLAFAIGTLLPMIMGASSLADLSAMDPAADLAEADPSMAMGLASSSMSAMVLMILGSILSGLGVAAISVGWYRHIILQEKPHLIHLGMREFWYFILPFLYLIPIGIVGGILFWLLSLLGLSIILTIVGVIFMVAFIFVFPPYYMLFMALVSFDMKQKERWATMRAMLSNMPVSTWLGYTVLMLLAMVLVIAVMFPLGLVTTSMATAEGAATTMMIVMIAGGFLNLFVTLLNVGLFVSYTGHILKVRSDYK